MRPIIKAILVIFIAIILVSSGYLAYVFLLEENTEKNTPPSEPELGTPLNDATGVSTSIELQWNADDPDDNDTLTYDVYFGTSRSPSRVSTNQTGTSYNPEGLDYETQYYWKIVVHDNHDEQTVGPIWTFTTSAEPTNSAPSTPTSPNPTNGATQVSTTVTLSWTGGDPDQDTVTYDVYFGMTSTPLKIKNNQTSTSYSPGTLQYNTKYYWKIISWDDQGLSTSGSVWSFTTKQQPSTEDEYTHTVFIEEATAGWCNNCPDVATILHDLYLSGDYRLYYVSLVHDKSTVAQQRLAEDYNVYGFPTVYVDGGYDVIVGAEDEATYTQSISKALSRAVPKIRVTIETQYHNDTKKFDTTVTITNGEQQQYLGTLKVYLTEKNSKWYDFDGNPYTYALIDFVVDKTITVPAGKSITETKSYDASSLDPVNLMLFAVVINSEKHQAYSQPPDEKKEHPFDAYYIDAVNAMSIKTGESINMPPSVGIEYPKQKRINIFGRSNRSAPLGKNTIIIGKTTFKVQASDDSSVVRVEFSIDGKVKANDTQAPYEWTVRKFGYIKHLLRKHTITVTAYDDKGKSASASLEFVALFL